jgi:GGDEF domain-containing protein
VTGKEDVMGIFTRDPTAGNGADRARDRWTSRAADRLPSFQELRPLFERELRRARRYERPLSALVLDFARTADPARRNERILLLGSLLQDALRETDLIGHLADTGELVTLLPETNAAAAARGAERIRKLWAEQVPVHLLVGTATYPADGLTLDDMLTSARREALSLLPGDRATPQRTNLAGA